MPFLTAPNAPARYFLLWLALGALLIRAATPAGWMPVATADGFHIEICSGSMSPAGQAATELRARMLVHAALPEQREKGGHAPGYANKQCPFAVLHYAFLPSFAPLVAGSAAYSYTSVRRPDAISVGRGLAAPPPPSTGPPIRS